MLILSIAEFAANATNSEAFNISPFELNRDFKLNMSFSHQHDLISTSPHQRQEFQRVEDIAHRMKDLLIRVKNCLKQAQERMIASANIHRQTVHFNVNDSV